MQPIHTKNRTIGLLGGSFNPAHAGHLHITLYALKKYKIDAVWWLVSPRNPLKDASSLAAYQQRLDSAREVAGAHPQIHVSDIERQYGTRYSYQTMTLLKKRYKGTHFVWLMGADNPPQFHRWRRWRALFATMPIMVFDRSPYSHTAHRSRAASYGHKFSRQNNQIGGFEQVPCFDFVHLRRNPLSSTYLRKKLGEWERLGHNKAVGVQ